MVDQLTNWIINEHKELERFCHHLKDLELRLLLTVIKARTYHSSVLANMPEKKTGNREILLSKHIIALIGQYQEFLTIVESEYDDKQSAVHQRLGVSFCL